MIKPHNDNTFQALWSWSIIHHQPHRCFLGSDQAKHHKPVTNILDVTLHQIFITCTPTLGLMIFSLCRFRLLSIPWSKTMLNQYLGPNSWGQHFGPNTTDQYHGPNTMDQNLVFQHVRAFTSVNLCVYVYAPFALLTHVYTHFHQV